MKINIKLIWVFVYLLSANNLNISGPTVVSGGSRNCFNSCSGCNSCGSYGGYTENISTGDISKTSNDTSDESNQRDKSSTVNADDQKFLSKSAKTIEHEFLFKTEHNSESSEINPNYDLNNSGSTYVLDFKDKVKCVEVKCRKCQTIWKNKPGTTSSLHFTKELSNLDFCSSVSDLISYDFIIKTEDYKTPSKDNDYNYDMRKSGTTYALNFKNDVECAEVKYCTISTIWKQDSSKYWKRYPKSISHNTQNQRTFVRFYGDEFNENSVDQSDIFENTAFPEYELSHYTGESINNYSFTSQQTVQGCNSLNISNPETCVSPEICSVPNKNELDNGSQTLDQSDICDYSILIDTHRSDDLYGDPIQSGVFV